MLGLDFFTINSRTATVGMRNYGSQRTATVTVNALVRS